MTYGGPRGVEYHSRSGEAHGLPHPFTHDRFVAVYGTFLARTPFLTERATVETGVCIAQQFFAVGAKNGILFFFPTVEAYHQLYCFLFACNTVFLHFIRFCRSGSQR